MKPFLVTLFVGIFLAMAIVTTAATLQRSMFTAGSDLWPDYWFRATLLDAYFGFITFYVWVAYKERTTIARASWLLAILLLGNFAMSAYVLLQLARTRPFSWENLLLRNPTPLAS